MNERTARLALGIGMPMVTLAAIIIPYLAVRSDLPDRVATHFDGSGTPDGSMSPGMMILTTLALAGLGVAGCAWLAWSRSPLPRSLAPTVGFLGGFLAGMGAGIALVTVLSQRGLDDWTEAPDVWALVVVPVVLGVALGVLASWFASILPAKPSTHLAGTPPSMKLDHGQHAVWTETLHSKWLLRFGVIAIVAGVVVAAGTFWWLMLPAVFSGVAMISFATLRVRADQHGLHIRYGILPWPRTSVDVADIETASVIDVRPMEWGGWGYRGSLKLMKQAAVVHRAGPGIRLDLVDGKVFVVTVDNPEQPVALLNAEARRAHSPAQ